MTKVSVIIPVFNTENYLEECLDSILAQQLEDIELICVNDGSVDSSPEILKRYAAEHPNMTVIDGLNEGQSAARNKALEKASGKYVYFMDSDDILTSNALRELYEECEEKELDILYFSGTSFYETDEMSKEFDIFENAYYREGEYKAVKGGPEFLAELLKNKDYTVSPCLQLIRRDFLDENNIRFIDGIIHEDNCFTFETLMNAKRVFCVNDIYFYRRIRAASVMTNCETIRNLQGYFACLVKQLEIAGSRDFNDPVLTSAAEYILQCLSRHVIRIFDIIPAAEKEQFVRELRPYERYIFRVFILETIREQNGGKKGPAWLAKKAKGGVRCVRDHGVVYTFKLAARKGKRKLGI